MDLQSATKYITKNRKAVLFLGAGFSLDAKTEQENFVPNSKLLSQAIMSTLSIPGDFPLAFAIDKLRESQTPKDAFNFLQETLSCDKLSKTQTDLLAYPWHRIYTTNIDNIGRQIFGDKCHDATESFQEPESGDFIYLHGDLSQCSHINYYQKVKMGEQLYIAGSHKNTEYRDQLAKDLSECDACFVIGYGMGDEDLAQLFYNSPDFQNKCFVFSGDTDLETNYRISLIGKDNQPPQRQ
jgi:hypothetical protein